MNILTLSDTSANAPAFLATAVITPYLAWTSGGGLGGAQPGYQLNLLAFSQELNPERPDLGFDPTRSRKIVLNEWTFERPALGLTGAPAPIGYRVWIAWTGTDPLRRLNLTWISPGQLALDDVGLVTENPKPKQDYF